MKEKIGLLIAGCAASGLAAIFARNTKPFVQEPGSDLLEELKLLASRIDEMRDDLETPIDDLWNMVPVCLHFDLRLRDADPYGRVPEYGATAVLVLAVAAKAFAEAAS